VSWRILLEDLETGWRQLAGGGPAALPPRTASFRRWAEHLVAMAGSAGVREHAGYWLEKIGGLPAALLESGDGGEVRSVRIALAPEETRKLLQEVPRAYPRRSRTCSWRLWWRLSPA